MEAKTLSLEQLQEGKRIVIANKLFEPSRQGFLMNVTQAWREGAISDEQKDELLKDLP